jgi:hypothetical protein
VRRGGGGGRGRKESKAKGQKDKRKKLGGQWPRGARAQRMLTPRAQGTARVRDGGGGGGGARAVRYPRGGQRTRPAIAAAAATAAGFSATAETFAVAAAA